MENKGNQISIEKWNEYIILYWFSWSATIRSDRRIYYNHRHGHTYNRVQLRKGCGNCREKPPEELKTMAMLQQFSQGSDG